MRKVLQLIDSFRQGGSESQAVQLARLLHQHGEYQVHVACLKNEGVLRPVLDSIGLTDIPEFPLNKFYDATAVRQVQRLSSYLKEMKIDIVHTHDFYTNIFGMAGAALARVPIRIASRRESSKREAHKRMVERCSYRLANAVVANCDAVRCQLIAEGVSSRKVFIVHNGLDIAYFTNNSDSNRERILAKLNLPAEPLLRFVVIVANLRPVKDYPTFLRAMQLVRQAIPNAAFLIAGEGDLLPSLQSLASELGIEKCTFFLGHCGNTADLIRLAEVCVLSSESEGFSNSILEYMAASRPVVATDVGGAREAILEGETGYLINPGDFQGLARNVVSLLSEPLKARNMGEKGRLRALESFSCERQLQSTEALYRSLLTTQSA